MAEDQDQGVELVEESASEPFREVREEIKEEKYENRTGTRPRFPDNADPTVG